MINSPIFILLTMFFAHIVDDYYLQGWLASAKQKKWWKENAPSFLYRHDYIMALMCHAFSWTFMIMLPLALHTNFDLGWFYLAYPVNMIIHAFVDNLKANKMKINLVKDQLIHFGQILVTFSLFFIINSQRG